MNSRFPDVEAIRGIWVRDRAVFLACYLLTLVIYSYFVTDVLFANHTLPNAWIYDYPSVKTTFEGRWFADILIRVFGGAGIQPLAMLLGAAIQAANGIVFAHLLGIKSRRDTFLITAFLCLHPAFLDYYSFTGDHIHFTAGDTMALLGVVVLSRSGRVMPVVVAGLLFMLCLAAYQPKIALVALLLAFSVLLAASDKDRSFASMVEIVGKAAAAFLLGVGFYLATSAHVIGADSLGRTDVNGLPEIWAQAVMSYPRLYAALTVHVDYMPAALAWLPGVLVVVGALYVLAAAVRNGAAMAGLVVLVLAVLPPLVFLSSVLNENTWTAAGRVNTPQAYYVLFFAGVLLLKSSVLRIPVAISLALMTYFFALVGAQENNAAALKSIYDVNRVNRIVARVEPLLSDETMPIAVFGHMPRSGGGRYRQFPNEYFRPHIASEMFVEYRQVEILNFFVGREAFVAPTPKELQAARAGLEGRKPWPDPSSVFVEDGVVVVLLERERADMPVTWAHER